ncbi:MAG: DNA-processing protein DprA [Burkholderiaceae bacterium]
MTDSPDAPPDYPPPDGRFPAADGDGSLDAWLRLSLTPGIGPVRGRRLLSGDGELRPPLEWSLAGLSDALGSSRLARALAAPDPVRDDRVAAALAWRRAGADHAIVTLADPGYPPRLLHLPDPPLVLYVLGDPRWLSHRQLAVVGSRRATALGLATARALAHALAASGWVVSSGLAEGIDRAGHEGALAAPGGATLAVMGTGIEQIYPGRHRRLADRIAASGALVTEQPVGMAPLGTNFPRRNRLLAALSHGVVVVEAAINSGSLITAQIAADLGREVFAVPGSIHSPQARGCHRLLRNGAALVETLGDILGQFTLDGEGGTSRESGRDTGRTDRDARDASGTDRGSGGTDHAATGSVGAEMTALLDRLAGGPVDADSLHATLGWPIDHLLVQLQLLELQGQLGRDLNGDWYRRI